jgi:hypothetical protein
LKHASLLGDTYHETSAQLKQQVRCAIIVPQQVALLGARRFQNDDWLTMDQLEKMIDEIQNGYGFLPNNGVRSGFFIL